MANKQAGYVSIKLDKQRKFKYTFNALVELEDILGKGFGQMEGNFKMKDLRSIVWAGLIHESPDLTVEEAGDLIDQAESIEAVAKAATEAIEMTVGNKKK
ncbi:hypothetical protein SAMN05444392_102272 [Seinonella peptonophila]|uniref:Phage tail assembly chaperone protein, TAC n=1 Tax=Seinonella peptonophila TaxID=112248 RepID=A0A1M4VB30_9BACL|nr:GTA-gp10 family protein [Seinonella peptonophila]SHE66174.1 hypothetical protein SAMN05444392_102272 [Seinonella peptonophila]